MKHILWFTFVASVVLLCACSVYASKKDNPETKILANFIEPDKKVKELLGDSITDLIFSPKDVVLYKLGSTTKPSDNDKTIGGVKVEKIIGKIDRNYYSIMQFLLSDSATYTGEKLVPAVPFKACMALEFQNKKEKVTLLYSFVSREMAIVKYGREVSHYHVGDIRKFILFFYNLTKDSDLEFYLGK